MTQQNIVITPADRILTVVVVFLVVLGIMSVFSASVPKCINYGISPLHFTLIQIGGVVLGYFALRMLCNFDYKKLVNVTNAFAFVVIGLLAIVLAVGDVINGAQRWISIGPFSL